MAIQNIQKLFSLIAAEQVLAYMTARQWRISSIVDRWQFESVDATGETQRLTLPNQTSHPKFRKLVPNLIFGLSVIEQREALDIANDIADTIAPPSPPTNNPSSTSASGPDLQTDAGSAADAQAVSRAVSQAATPPVAVQPLAATFHNTGSGPASVSFADGQTCEIPSGQAITVQLGSARNHLYVKFSQQLQVRASDSMSDTSDASATSSIKSWWALPPAPSTNTRELWLMQFLAAAIESEPQLAQARVELLPRWQSAVQRFLFALSELDDASQEPRAWRMASATLLVEIIQSVPETIAWQARAYELALKLAAIGQQRFVVSAAAASELWQVARQDSGSAPNATRRWLVRNIVA